MFPSLLVGLLTFPSLPAPVLNASYAPSEIYENIKLKETPSPSPSFLKGVTNRYVFNFFIFNPIPEKQPLLYSPLPLSGVENEMH